MLNDADDAFLSGLRETLPEAAFRETTELYTRESRDRWRGRGHVVAPGSAEEVAEVVRACAEARVPIVPFGGGTGLVGGQLSGEGAVPVILTLERMTRIREVRPEENVLIADGGAVLADIHSAAEEADRLFPLSLASEGTARIGGLLATNAGGLNVLRYGNARALCLGVEAVTAEGRVWHGLNRLRKDNTGYDLRDLIIGSEGTLGIITGAALRLFPRPAAYGTAMLAVPSPDAAVELLGMAGRRLGETISGFELMHRQGLDFLAETGPEVTPPFAETPDWMVLVEIGTPPGMAPDEALEELFAEAAEAELVTDGVIARSEAQRAALWSVRESIPEANRRIGSISSHDISVPISSIPDFIVEGGKRLGRLGNLRINCFGHLGDGNLHYNVFPARGESRDDHKDIRDEVKRTVHDLVHEMQGSVSAEHGVGRLKVDDLERYADPEKLRMMRAIKSALDPQGILNPGAVLAADQGQR
ncbi:FAD-binding oxidoreductase [Histidinibacterium aquaticum]|uniref:FAD-binding oxidoreductase n=1 Tax=Histidinibacterium aquaticum TaxID=2613962 RepID=A0A5J5GIG8_9RHOB|nr:FAD-binding oxidoreductase [Histidinibacterium aquaticum]KAA9008059.1 FAD-binding oxidoreductase [Histidinibacterium aquaticum]